MSTSYRKWLKDRLAVLDSIDCYTAGATPETLAKQIGVPPSEIVKLNFNESLFVDRAKQARLVKEIADELDLRLYPEDEVPKSSTSLADLSEPPQNV
jgi:histidinol-phosphate/aromatic aminotransferase/cobyric acid decarboxylase-like protein